jgi:hypothetical protein
LPNWFFFFFFFVAKQVMQKNLGSKSVKSDWLE